MQDGIIKGTGNSRYLKSISNFLQQYPTYQDFVAALVAGTLPIDLNGINETGWDQLGTALNTANLLSGETAAALGLPSTAVPNDALRELYVLEETSYVGTGEAGQDHPNTLTFSGPIIFVVVFGDGLPAFFTQSGLGVRIGSASNTVLSTTVSGNTMSWYHGTNAGNQMNTAGYTYYALAILEPMSQW